MQFTIHTKGHGDFHNITDKVAEEVRQSGIHDGIVCAFVGGTTAGMTIIDDEEGHKEDIRAMLERIAPKDAHYEHNTPGDRNGHAHLHCALMGASVTIPVVKGELALGTWQRVFVVDFDSRPRERLVTISIVGK